MSELSVVILTYNEEENLPACLQSVVSIAHEVFVVDSFSTDQTLEIADSYGAQIYQQRFETHAKQWNSAFRNLPMTGEWILALDADQRLSAPLILELRELLKTSDVGTCDGYYVKRRYFFRGKAVRFGGYQSKWMLKMFRRGMAETDEGELVDAHFYLKSRQIGYLKQDLIEENIRDNDLAVWMEKQRRYAKLQAQDEMLRTKRKKEDGKLGARLFGNPDERIL